MFDNFSWDRFIDMSKSQADFAVRKEIPLFHPVMVL